MRVPSLVIALLAVALAAGLFALEGDVNLNLYDEGYLWYITTRTALGDVPMRDVRSYEPGRYYWGAAWFALLGPGLVTLRVGLAAVQALGLGMGLLALRRAVQRWWLLAGLGAILLLWMFPAYKAFESAAVLAFIWLAVRLVERPGPARFFAAGVGVGLAAFVRLDHGVYGTVGFLLVILVLARDARPVRALATWAAGVAVGYAPMLVMFVTVPGFMGAYAEYLGAIFGIVARSGGNTNLGLPIPWPSLVDTGDPPLLRLHQQSIGVLFIAVLVVYQVAAIVALRSAGDDSRPRRLVLAAGLVGLPYLHYAFSRPDLEHLAPSVQALVVIATGLVAMLRPRLRLAVGAVALALMLALTGLGVGMLHSAFDRAMAGRSGYVRARVAQDLVWVPARTAAMFDAVRRAVDRTLQPGERILVVPYWPGLYTVLERESPLRETYFLLPETDDRQRAMIARLERQNVRLVFFTNTSLDNRADLHFSQTHALIFRYLAERYEEVPLGGLPRWAHLLRRKPSAAALAR